MARRGAGGLAARGRRVVIECRAGEGVALRFERLSAEAGVAHGVFTRLGGVSAAPYASLNASVSTGDDAAAVSRNQAIIEATLGLPLRAARPVHGADVVEMTPGDEDWIEGYGPVRMRTTTADAMVTRARGLGLFWAFADCTPILFYDPAHQAVALAHAGWRGTAQAVARHAVAALTVLYDTRPGDLLAGIGPAIGPCCYEVSEEVRARFRATPDAWASARFEERMGANGEEPGARLYLDLWESNRRQLLAAGLRPEHIELAGLCTGCRTDLFYSHRVEHGNTGRFGVAIGLVADS